jgi:putative heme-binding domain-containing protein
MRRTENWLSHAVVFGLGLLVGSFALVHANAQDASSPSAYRDFATRRDGIVARGRELFFSVEKGACAQCHSVGDSAVKAGPDLFAVGDKFPRRDLITAILEPSADIAVGYDATIIETKAGDTFYGVVKQATAAHLELMGADGKPVRVMTADIKERRASPVSLMPQGVAATLSLQEFTDVIEYLVSLKQPVNSLMSTRGMPEIIPQAPKAVKLRPFFSESLRFPSSTVQKPGDVRSGLVWFGQIPGRRDAFVGLHQLGQIWRIEKSASGDTKSLFADFTAEVYGQRGPNGLVSLAFHPKFRENRKYYLKHQVLEDGNIMTVLVEKRAAADLLTDSGEPSRRLLTIATVTQNHTGGFIEFGPDGYLYLGMGDTGPQEDPNGHGQDLSLLLGKMLRIDVDRRDGELPYSIPPDNPFRGQTGARPEIWAFGFREPWRFSFDSLTGDLWVGDVGQNRVEEVTIVRKGENHGWNVYEAFEPFSNLRRKEGQVYVPPVFAYRRNYGNSVTGGHVFRRDKASSFYGTYIFGDYTSRLIWAMKEDQRSLKSIWQIGQSPEGIASFAIDEQGRIFVVGYEGMVYEIDLSSGEYPATPIEAAVNSIP